MKGLINIGNSCYLNAALQMILQNIDLCNLILKYGDYTEKLIIFKNFIIEYHQNNSNNIINPIQIKQLLDQRLTNFIGNDQHDPTEVIPFILDIIELELKNICRIGEFKKIFDIDYNQRIKCKRRDCLNISERIEKNYYILLSMDENCKTLDDLYTKTFNREMFDEENKYFCEQCQKNSVASKKIKIELNSNSMIIGLNRYIYDKNTNSINKNNQDIDIPLEWKFDTYLQNAIIHYGFAEGGHYISLGRFNNKWYSFNDTNISEINENQLSNLLRKAYCLYYVKK